MAQPAFTIGIEEGYLLVDRDTCALVEAPEVIAMEPASAAAGAIPPPLTYSPATMGGEGEIKCLLVAATNPSDGPRRRREEKSR